MNELEIKGKACKEASYEWMNVSSEEKDSVLVTIANALFEHQDEILKANQKDIDIAKANQKPSAFIDRLTLNENRLHQIIAGVHKVKDLHDPCNIILNEWNRDELHFIKKSVPIGVIGMIYEARPNVSVDAAVLCLKAGNTCFLRGSKDTLYSNRILVHIMKQAIKNAGYNEHIIQLLEDTSRETAVAFMQLNRYLDLLIPRGSANLIQNALQNATVPIIETGSGNCHVYVDEEVDYQQAIAIILNAKCQRVSVCNACESILIHQNIVDTFAHQLIEALKQQNVKIHCDPILCKLNSSLIEASEADYYQEYLALEVSIKVVRHVQEAIIHINKHSTHHSDVIVSTNENHIEAFLNGVDSAVVYANASSRFSDGEEFGLGAEIGISTQKIHARGPMGLEALTSYKYIVRGNGTVRK